VRFSLKGLLVVVACVAVACVVPPGLALRESLPLIAVRAAVALCVVGLFDQIRDGVRAAQATSSGGLRDGLLAMSLGRAVAGGYLLYWLVNGRAKLYVFAPYDDTIAYALVALVFAAGPARRPAPRWPRARRAVEAVCLVAIAALALVWWADAGVITHLVDIAIRGIVLALPNNHAPEIAPYTRASAAPLFWLSLASPLVLAALAIGIRQLAARWPELGRTARVASLAVAAVCVGALLVLVQWVVRVGVPLASPVIAGSGWGPQWRDQVWPLVFGLSFLVLIATGYWAGRWSAWAPGVALSWRSTTPYPHECRWTATLFLVGAISQVHWFFDSLDELYYVLELEHGLWLAAALASLHQLLRRWPDPEELARQAAPPALSPVALLVVWLALVGLTLAAGVLLAAFSAMVWMYPVYIG
jgi:hypothetical protein